jgi:plasmid stabilization system protein ParE
MTELIPFRRKIMAVSIRLDPEIEQRLDREKRELLINKLYSMFNALTDNALPCGPPDDARASYFKNREGLHLNFYRLDTNSNFKIIRILHKRLELALYS